MMDMETNEAATQNGSLDQCESLPSKIPHIVDQAPTTQIIYSSPFSPRVSGASTSPSQATPQKIHSHIPIPISVFSPTVNSKPLRKEPKHSLLPTQTVNGRPKEEIQKPKEVHTEKVAEPAPPQEAKEAPKVFQGQNDSTERNGQLQPLKNGEFSHFPPVVNSEIRFRTKKRARPWISLSSYFICT